MKVLTMLVMYPISFLSTGSFWSQLHIFCEFESWKHSLGSLMPHSHNFWPYSEPEKQLCLSLYLSLHSPKCVNFDKQQLNQNEKIFQILYTKYLPNYQIITLIICLHDSDESIKADIWSIDVSYCMLSWQQSLVVQLLII